MFPPATSSAPPPLLSAFSLPSFVIQLPLSLDLYLALYFAKLCSSIALSPLITLLSLARSLSSVYTSAFGLSRSFRSRISRAWRFTLNVGPFPSAVPREHARWFGRGGRVNRGEGEKGLFLARLSLCRGRENCPKIRGREIRRSVFACCEHTTRTLAVKGRLRAVASLDLVLSRFSWRRSR